MEPRRPASEVPFLYISVILYGLGTLNRVMDSIPSRSCERFVVELLRTMTAGKTDPDAGNQADSATPRGFGEIK